MQVVHRYEKSDPNFGWEFEDWNFNTVFKASSKEETKLKLSVLGYRLLSGVRYESQGYTIYDVSAEIQGPGKRRPLTFAVRRKSIGSRPARGSDRPAADMESCPEQDCRLIAKA